MSSSKTLTHASMCGPVWIQFGFYHRLEDVGRGYKFLQREIFSTVFTQQPHSKVTAVCVRQEEVRDHPSSDHLMARPLLGSYHHHHHLHGGTITISTEVIVMIPLEPPETPHHAKFQPLSALFQLCVSLLFNPWWWYHPKEQTIFLFCNRYDCIQKHWLIVQPARWER